MFSPESDMFNKPFNYFYAEKYRQPLIAEIGRHTWFWYDICGKSGAALVQGLNNPTVTFCNIDVKMSDRDRASKLLEEIRQTEKYEMYQFMKILQKLSDSGDKSLVVDNLLAFHALISCMYSFDFNNFIENMLLSAIILKKC